MAGLKMRVPKTVIYTALSIIVLLVLLVGGGVAYVWYTGQNEEIPAAAAPPDHTSDIMPAPTKPAENANASASIQVLTSPVAPGDNASLSIKALPTSKCTISVVYDTTASTDSGLIEKTADEFGIVDWTWTVGAAVPLGTWPVKVTCAYNGRTAVVQGDLVVAR